MSYQKPDAEVIEFDNQDIVTSSNTNCGHKTSGHGGDGCANAGHSADPSWRCDHSNQK